MQSQLTQPNHIHTRKKTHCHRHVSELEATPVVLRLPVPVLDACTGGVIGCVCIYPASGGPGRRRAAVSSWVRADRAELDNVVYDAVLTWLERDWPFDAVEYAART